MKSLITFLSFLTFFVSAHARIGCMSHKKNVDSTELDFKILRYVRCSCPCEKKYKQLRGMLCSECGHRHLIPREIQVASQDLQATGNLIKPGIFSGYSFYGKER